MKRQFIEAVAYLEGSRGEWLRYQVRHAQEPVDLWLLRGAVFSALNGRDEQTRRTRLDLYRALDNVFPDSHSVEAYLPL
ncbi:MAG: hypothetical protein HY021_01435 [Burkholderiales bacterium]|nr:hypothetical protein [Burkholderiales bacterium]